MTRLAFGLLGGLALIAGCGLDTDLFGNAGSSSDGGTSETTSATGGGGDGGTPGTGGNGGAPSCEPIPAATALRPLDLLLLVDHSGSTQAIWNQIEAEVNDFASAARPAGTHLAINLNPDFGNNNNACDVSHYAPFDVDYAEIPGAAAAVAAEMESWGFAQGGSPINPPLQGSLLQAVNHHNANPDHASALVFMMDSQATLCDNNPSETSQMLTSALAAGIRTYAIELESTQPADLSAIAAAGGTGMPFDLTAFGATAMLQATLEEIRVRAIPCELPLPATPMGATDDPALIALEHTPSGMSKTTIPRVANEGACGDAAGWYFDDATNPSVLKLCRLSCDLIKKDPAPTVEVVFGCAGTLDD